MTSLEDWQRLTWSLGWTGLRVPRGWPSSSLARLAITSLAFMLVEVPEPVWKMSTTKSASKRPSATSCGGLDDGVDLRPAARAPSKRPRSRLISAAARLIRPRARIRRRVEAVVADREVLHRPLGRGAVVGAGGDGQLAHRVALDRASRRARWAPGRRSSPFGLMLPASPASAASPACAGAAGRARGARRGGAPCRLPGASAMVPPPGAGGRRCAARNSVATRSEDGRPAGGLCYSPADPSRGPGDTVRTRPGWSRPWRRSPVPLPRPALRGPRRSYFNTSVGHQGPDGGHGAAAVPLPDPAPGGEPAPVPGAGDLQRLLPPPDLQPPGDPGGDRPGGDLRHPRLQGGDQLRGQPPGAPGGVPQVHLDAGGPSRKSAGLHAP